MADSPSVSPDQLENTRKIGARFCGVVLRRLAEVTQERAADFMGVSASTISRAKEDIERICHLFAAIGLQVAPLDAVVVSRDDIQALERMAYKYLQSRIEGGTD
ncbi:MAG: lambda phage CII family protein [Pseudomonadales bacterium]|nr:lambda phage CII family protein [Pseudomonadales bacterium]